MIQLNSSITVLIAERSLSVADLLARSLSQHGYKIVGIVHSGEQAIEAATLRVPDIVLMDVSLSGMVDGLTAAWKIYHELNCPVVYMAAHAKHMALLQGTYLAEIRGTLMKPFTADALTQTIAATLEQYRLKQVGKAAETTAAFPVLTAPAMPHRVHSDVAHSDVAHSDTHDQFLLRLLAIASKIKPMPRVFFQAGALTILTSTVDSARSLSSLCRSQNLPYPYQIFIWRWRNHQYLPYDSTQH